MKTVIQAKAIISISVPDWGDEVLHEAAHHALSGRSPWTFPGRPHDQSEMDAFCEAFDEIQE